MKDTRTNNTAYSENPAMCLRDYLLNKRYGLGRWLTSDMIDEDSFKECADQIFGYTNIGATNLSFGMDRIYIVSNGLIKGFPFAVSSYSSSSAHSNSLSSKAFDRTVTNYLYVSIELVNTADQARLEGIQLTNS